jgi:uncharacterized Tic20 family protein
MSVQATVSQDERVLAGLAHGSILMGLFTGGVGGMVAALVIWLSQKEKSAYVAGQALQALIYQAFTFFIIMAVWICWGLLWMVSILQPLIANPEAYDNGPPAGMWIGLVLMIIPLGVWGLTIFYGLYGAARSLGGHDFKYAVVGNWLRSQR